MGGGCDKRETQGGRLGERALKHIGLYSEQSGGLGQGWRPEAPDCEVTELFKGSLWLLCGQDTYAPDRSRVNGAWPRSSHLNALLSGAGSLSSRASPLSPTGISCLAWRTGALREKRRKKVLNNSGSNPMINIFRQTHCEKYTQSHQ